MPLELLINAIKKQSPISFEYNKEGKTSGLRIGNPHAIFIMRKKDGTESTKIDIVQTGGVSDTYPPNFPDWRMFDLTEISKVVLNDKEGPFTIDPGYKPESERYKFVIAKI
jgi:hypothetical protein